MPKISIISPIYNHAKYVEAAIDSMLGQTFADFEMIITNDGSTDDSAERIQRYTDSRIKFHQLDKNRGTVLASINSWKHSSGEFIVWFATDDMAQPHMLETLYQHLQANPDSLAVFGCADYVDEDGNYIREEFPSAGVGLSRFELLNRMFRCENLICCTAGLIRRRVLEEIGFFQPNLIQISDMAHWIRILFRGDIDIIADKVLKFRIRANNANASASRPDSMNRAYFEHFEVLNLFPENINTVELLTQIFPEILNHPWPLEERLIPFHLAQLALSTDLSFNKLFGLHLLFKLTSDREGAQYLYETCNFDYPDLFQLEGQSSVFWEIVYGHQSKGLVTEKNRLVADNTRLQTYNAQLERELKAVFASKSWKLTEALRQWNRILRNDSRI